MDPYALTTHDGKTVDVITHYALLAAEQILGYKLSVTQGCYQALDGADNDVVASAGTHDGGGVVDLDAWDHERKVRALRRVGFAAWYRPELWRNGVRVWGPHIHAVLIGNAKLAPVAAEQVDAYRAGRDGLADNAADPSWRPDPIRAFAWPVVYTRGARVDALIVKTVAALAVAKGRARRVALRASLRALRSVPKRIKL